MYAQIPPDEYARLAKQFTARKFDADEWARTAKAAGMKYMVFTAKHADGFAMYGSQVSDYNIVDATPFGRDAVAELGEGMPEARPPVRRLLQPGPGPARAGRGRLQPQGRDGRFARGLRAIHGQEGPCRR